MPHTKLLSKLSSIGIKGVLLEWIKSYLSFRKQFVKVGDSISDDADIISGAPQGSVLGPLLFILYINDLPSHISHAFIRLYVDDVKLYLPVSSAYDAKLLQSDIDAIIKWSNENHLSLASHKCFALHLGFGEINYYSYYINGCLIKNKDVIKDLGVFIDSRLDFKSHINSIVQRASVMSSSLFRSFRCRNRAFLVRLFNVFVRPLLEYACPVWSPHSFQLIDQIESVQRRFTKQLPGLANVSYSQRLSILKIDSLQLRRIVFDLVVLYKIIYGLIVLYAADFITYHNLNTRGHTLKLLKIRSNSNLCLYSFPNRIISLWISLSSDTVYATSVNSFKARLLSTDYHLLSALLRDGAQR